MVGTGSVQTLQYLAHGGMVDMEKVQRVILQGQGAVKDHVGVARLVAAAIACRQVEVVNAWTPGVGVQPLAVHLQVALHQATHPLG